MLNKIIAYSLNNKLIVIIFLVALIGFGSYQVTRLPIDTVPDITNNQVQVITVASALGATDIERLVTFPVEQACSNIPGLTEIRSFSRFGLSVVTIVFEDDLDIYRVRQIVSERLQNISDMIPANAGTPELGPVTTGLGEIYQYVVKPKKGFEKKYSLTELRSIQDWIIRRQLLSVKGVAEVSSFGGKVKQYEVAVDPLRLNAFKLTISDILNALEINNQNTGGAYIEKGGNAIYIRTEGLVKSKEDVENIVIKSQSDGSPLLIKHVAELKTGAATRFGALTYNNEGEVAGAVVMMLKNENSNRVIELVKERIVQIQKTLPEGVEIEAFLDRTKMVNNAISTVSKNLLEGALIVVFVLVLFLGNLRAGLIVASVIPLSMLFAIIMMNLFGVSGNLMSLGALDFGLIVDGAVIIVEAVLHGFHKNNNIRFNNSSEKNDFVKNSAGKMMNSAVFGQIIILAVYLPVFTLQGIEGKMFRPMAQTVTFALIGAFLLSITYIPVMSALLLKTKNSNKENLSERFIKKLQVLYSNLLKKALLKSKIVIATTIAMFLLSIALLFSLGGEFIPVLEEGDFAVETRALPGTALTTMINSTSKAAGLLKESFPEVEKVVTKIGSSEIPTDPMPLDAADMIVVLKDKSEWTSASTFNELAESMKSKLSEMPGLSYSFQYPVQMRFNELMTGAKQDVVCKLFGDNLDTLSRYGEKILNLVAKIEGASDLYLEPVQGVPQLVVEFKREQMSKYNISVSRANSIINASFAGSKAGTVYEDEKRFALIARIDTSSRNSAEHLRDLLIPLQDGNQIPLRMIADVQLKNGPNQIQREDAKRRLIVAFNVRGRDVQSVVNELQKQIEQSIDFPAGYYPVYGGTFENLNAAKKRLSIAVPVSLLIIFLLLYFAFHSVRQAFLIYSAIPLSAMGGIFSLAIRDMPFSISAGIGFIALFGVAVLNGLVLVAELNRLKIKSGSLSNEELIRGCVSRLRPVLMTALVASLGFLPMALSTSAGAEVQKPLATVVIGGLLLATLLTLFVLPVLYKNSEMKLNISRTSSAILLFLVLSFKALPQQNISLPAALDTALKNNSGIKNSALLMEYYRLNKKTALDLPKTELAVEAGQINSVYHDNRITVTQNFGQLFEYTSRKKMLTEEWKSTLLENALKKAELKRNTTLLFYRIILLTEKKKFLLTADSVFIEAVKAVTVQFKKGSITALQKSLIESSHSQVKLQLLTTSNQLAIAEAEFKLCLNSNENYRLISNTLKADNLNEKNTLSTEHPEMRFWLQQKNIAEKQRRMQSSKLLPDFFLQYSNTTFKGFGADNVFYTAGSRFWSFQAGIGIPIFSGALRSRVNSARVQEMIAQNNMEAAELRTRNTVEVLIKQATEQKNILGNLETSALTNSQEFFAAAGAQLRAGEITVADWSLVVQQYVNTRFYYLEALNEYNETVIHLNYYSEK